MHAGSGDGIWSFGETNTFAHSVDKRQQVYGLCGATMSGWILELLDIQVTAFCPCIKQTVEANVCCRGGRDDFRPAGSEYVYLSYAPCLLLLQLSNVSLFSLDVGHISPVVYGKINFNFIVMLGLFLRSPWRSSSGQHVTWLLVMISLYKRKQMRPDRKQLIHSWNIQKEPESSWQLLKSDN